MASNSMTTRALATCDLDATGRRRDRRHPGSGHAGRDAGRDDRWRWGRSHRDDREPPPGAPTGAPPGRPGSTAAGRRDRGATGATATGAATGATDGPGRPPGPLPKAAGDLGIIAGLGRGMPGRGRRRHERPADAADAGRRLGLRRAQRWARAPDGDPCPGWARTGCCPGAGPRDGRPGAGPGSRLLAAGAAGASGSAGGRLGLGHGGLGAGLRGRARRPGRAPRRERPRQEPRPASRRRLGAAGSAAGLGAGLGRGLLGRRRGRGVGGGSGGRSGLQLVAVLLLEPHLDGGSTVDDADLTNSPISLSFSRTNLLSTPNSLASSWTRVLATVEYYSFWSVDPRRRAKRTS